MKTLAKYHFDPRFRSFEKFADRAQEIGEALETLRAEEGAGDFQAIPPERIVEAARRTRGALHDCILDKDQKQAAQSWYLHRAVQLTGSVIRAEIQFRKPDGKELVKVVRPFVKAPSGGYTSIQIALQQDEVRDYILDRLIRRLWSLAQEYSTFEELAEVFQAVEKVARKRGVLEQA